MVRRLIWDLPTRLFHWLFVAGFVFTAFVALVLGEHSRVFAYHAMVGLALALMVSLRVVWGFVGTRYARFGSFAFGPGAVFAYVKGTIVGGGKRYIGHNPGSAVAIFAMLGLVIALAVTGVMLGRDVEGVKELHEVLSYVLVGVVGLHMLGVAWHTIRHRENITASMVHGHKKAGDGEGIGSPRRVVALVFVVLVGAWFGALVRNYDSVEGTTRLPVVGMVLHLTEGTDEDEGGNHSED